MFFVLLGVLLAAVMFLKDGIIPPSVVAPIVVIAGLYLRPKWMALACVTYVLLLMVYMIGAMVHGTTITLATWVAIVANVTVIALWLGHESTDATQIYLHADMTLKENAIAKVTPPATYAQGHYQPPDAVLAFLIAL